MRCDTPCHVAVGLAWHVYCTKAYIRTIRARNSNQTHEDFDIEQQTATYTLPHKCSIRSGNFDSMRIQKKMKFFSSISDISILKGKFA